MFDGKRRMRILFAALLLASVASGCANGPSRNPSAKELASTKYDLYALDVFHVAFAPGADESERTFSWHTRGYEQKGCGGVEPVG